jgi:hypothetical protein
MVPVAFAGTVAKPTRFRPSRSIRLAARARPSFKKSGPMAPHRVIGLFIEQVRDRCVRRVAATRHPLRKLVGQFPNLFFAFRPRFKSGCTTQALMRSRSGITATARRGRQGLRRHGGSV